MAVVYPNANDNWSTVANWYSGGSPYGQIPQAGDTVCLNGKTVVVDMEINLGISTITTVATSPAVAGGKLTLTVANNIVANLQSGSTDVLESSLITGTAVIIGNCTNTGRNVITNSGSGNLQVLGNVYGGAINYSGIYNSSTGNVEVIGNVYGSLSSSSAGINNTASGNNILVTGNVYGGSGHGIYAPTTCTVKITGIATISPTGTRSAVFMSSINSLFIIDGLLINVGNVNAVHVPCIQVSSTTDTTWTVAKETGGTSVLSNNVTDIYLPAENDTRKDTTYGTVGQFTGTLAVPPPESVALNVPTDNTVGSAVLTAADFLTELANSSDPLAVRLRNVATAEIVGDQFEAFKNQQ